MVRMYVSISELSYLIRVGRLYWRTTPYIAGFCVWQSLAEEDQFACSQWVSPWQLWRPTWCERTPRFRGGSTSFDSGSVCSPLTVGCSSIPQLLNALFVNLTELCTWNQEPIPVEKLIRVTFLCYWTPNINNKIFQLMTNGCLAFTFCKLIKKIAL